MAHGRENRNEIFLWPLDARDKSMLTLHDEENAIDRECRRGTRTHDDFRTLQPDWKDAELVYKWTGHDREIMAG